MLIDIYFGQYASLVAIWIALLGVVFASWFFKHNKVLKLAFVPIMFGALFFTFIANESILGKPSPNLPTTEFTYIAHKVQSINEWSNKYIVFWASTKDEGSRLYIMKYSAEEEKKLKKARKKTKRGKAVKGKLVIKKKKNGTQVKTLQLYDIKIQDIFKK